MIVRVPDINGNLKQKSKSTRIKIQGKNKRETTANKHPNVQYTENGGAAPYVHSPHCLYDMRYLLSTMEETE